MYSDDSPNPQTCTETITKMIGSWKTTNLCWAPGTADRQWVTEGTTCSWKSKYVVGQPAGWPDIRSVSTGEMTATGLARIRTDTNRARNDISTQAFDQTNHCVSQASGRFLYILFFGGALN